MIRSLTRRCNKMASIVDSDRLLSSVQELLKDAGLYNRQHGYYARVMSGTLSLFILGIMGIILTHNTLWILLLVAVFQSFVSTQFGFLAHDAVHDQIFASQKANRAIALFCGFVMWLSPSWWGDKHNTHHRYPNALGKDRDINISIFALTQIQALSKHWPITIIVKYQAIFFIPAIFMLEALSIRLDSLQHLIFSLLGKKEVTYRPVEFAIFLIHPIVYFGLLFWLIDPWYHAALFIGVHQGFLGVYMGLVFATNHKGMLMIDEDTKLDSLRLQVLTTRNVTGGWLVDFLMGGLNFQIPHHINSWMPRCNFKKANEICRDFCEEHDITYCEMSVWKAYHTIFAFLHRIGSVLRKKLATS